MLKKILCIFYIVFFAPVFVNGLLPFLQYVWVIKEAPYIPIKEYYVTEIIIIVVSILIFAFLLFYMNRQVNINIVYFIAGIIMSILVTVLFKYFIKNLLLNGYITLCISIVVYALCILLRKKDRNIMVNYYHL